MDPAYASLDPQSLLRECTWVRQLAHRMIRDGHLADDLSQEVLLRAWQGSNGQAAGSAHGHRRPWVRVALRNLLRMHWRSKGRREERELTHARPTESPSTEEAVRRAELQQHVVRAVLQLAEPYRATVLLRYLEERPVAEVAERMGVPPSTVRVRSKRALEQLHRSLIAECGDDPRAYLTGMCLLAGLPQAGPGGVAAPWTNLFRGSPLMLNLTLALVVAVATWSTGALGVLTDPARTVEPALVETLAGAPSPTQDSPSTVPGRRPAPAAGARGRIQAVGSAPSQEESTEQHGQRGPATLQGTVVDPTGAPLAGVSVSVFPQRLSGARSPVLAPQETLLSDAQGSFVSESLTGFITYGLLFEKAGFVPRIKNQFARETGPVRLFRAVPLTGHVLKGDALTPVAGAQLNVTSPPGLGMPHRSTKSASDGSFEIDGLPSGLSTTIEVQTGTGLPSKYEVRLGETSPSACRLVLRERTHVDGLVVDFETGEPVPYASVLGGSGSKEAAEVDASGRFRLELDQELLAGATYDHDITTHDQEVLKGQWLGASVRVSAEGYVSTSTPLWLAKPELGRPFRVPLLRASTISGSVTHADGRPAEGVVVAWDDVPFRDLGAAAWATPMRGNGVRTDGAGRYELAAVPAVPTRPGILTFRSQEGDAHVESSACPGQVGQARVLDVTLGAQPMLVGTTHLNGEPTQAYVYVTNANQESLRATRTDTTGRFVLEGLPEGPLFLEACTADGSAIWSEPIEATFPPANTEPLRVDIVAEVPEVRGRVLGTDGTPLEGVKVLAHPQRKRGTAGRGMLLAGSGRTDSEGYFRIAVNEDAALTISVLHHQSSFEQLDVLPGADPLEFYLPEFASVELLLSAQDQAEIREVSVRWREDHSGTEGVLLSGQAMAVSLGGRLSLQLPIGRVQLEVLSPSSGQRASVVREVPHPTERPQEILVELGTERP